MSSYFNSLNSCLDDFSTRSPFIKYLLPASNLVQDARFFRGRERSAGQPISILMLGRNKRMLYLLSAVFAGEPEQLNLGNISSFSSRRIIENHKPDMVIWRTDSIVRRFGRKQDVLALPEWISFCRDEPPDFENATKFGDLNRELRSNIVKLHKNAFSYRISDNIKDFNLFYYDMYLPYVKKRYDNSAIICRKNTLKKYFNHGGRLIFIEKDDEKIAGALCYTTKNTAYFHKLGVINGEIKYLRVGAITALYYFWMDWARNNGYKRIDFGAARPFIRDGIFKFKRKWGMGIHKNADSHSFFYLRVTKFTPAVFSFLKANPLVFLNNGRLNGFIFSDSDKPLTALDVWNHHKSFWTPGIDKIHLISAAGFKKGLFDGHIGVVDMSEIRNIYNLVCFQNKTWGQLVSELYA